MLVENLNIGDVMMFFVAAVCIAVLAVAAYQTFFIVPQQKSYIVERLGRFHRVAAPGLHAKIPLVDRVVAKMDLRTRQALLEMDAKTKDNVTVVLGISVQYRIAGPDALYNAYYLLSNPVGQMQSYITDALRSTIPTHTLDGVFDNKEAIARSVQGAVAETMRSYGYDIVATLIVNIALPKDVEASMNAINAAQRKKEAAQSLAEAEKIRIVTEAQAEKERIIMEAAGKAEAAEQAGIGIANQRKAIAEGISSSLEQIRSAGSTLEDANRLFMFTQWADMMEGLAKGAGTTVILPAGFRDSAGQFDQMVSAIAAAQPFAGGDRE